MIRNIIILILCLTELSLNAQAKLALTSSEYKPINYHHALINKLMIELKGCEWYEKYIINNKNYRSKNNKIIVNYNGTIYQNNNQYVSQEISEALELVINYIEQNNLVIYKTEFIDNIIHTDFSKEKNKELLIKYIVWSTKNSNSQIYFTEILGVLQTDEKLLRYNNYVKKEKNAGREPAISRCEWLMNEFEKVLAIPIKSTLDYDITINELNMFIPPLKF